MKWSSYNLHTVLVGMQIAQLLWKSFFKNQTYTSHRTHNSTHRYLSTRNENLSKQKPDANVTETAEKWKKTPHVNQQVNSISIQWNTSQWYNMDKSHKYRAVHSLLFHVCENTEKTKLKWQKAVSGCLGTRGGGGTNRHQETLAGLCTSKIHWTVDIKQLNV